MYTNLSQIKTIGIRYTPFLFFVILLFFVNSVNAQFNEPGVNRHEATSVVPPSPTAAAFAQYGNFPVDMANGTPNISFPLYTLQGDGVSLPISLSYHAGGLKVDQISSWVGLGWSLNAGGVVTRSVVGKPDELYNGYMYTAPNIIYPFEATGASFAVLESIGSGYQDGQPDQFNFNIGGYSGSFFFTAPNEIHLITHQDLKIEELYGPPGEQYIDAFKITTPDGIEYFFDQKEYSKIEKYTEQGGASCNTLYGDPNDFAPTSWYLSKIFNPNTKDSITLSYESHTISYDLAYFANHTIRNLIGDSYHCSSANQSCSGYTVKEENGLHLSTITSKYGSVSFTSLGGRSDLKTVEGSDNRLSKIEIKGAQNTLLKEFNFTQSFTESIDQVNPPIHPHREFRMYLESVQELGADGSSKPPYSFAYTKRDLLPARLSFSQDHWGYFNGADNSVMIPASSYNGIEYGGAIALITGANRETNIDYADYGLISQITYPTGGTTSFMFEGHHYTSSTSVPEVVPFDSGIIAASPGCEAFDPSCEEEDESVSFTLQNAQNIILHRWIRQHIPPYGGPPFSTPLPECGIKRYDDSLQNWVDVVLIGEFPFSEDPSGMTESGEIWNIQGSTNLGIELPDGVYKLWAKSGQGMTLAGIQLWCNSESGNQIFPEIATGGARIQQMSSSASEALDDIVKRYEYQPFYYTGSGSHFYERMESNRTESFSTPCSYVDCQQLILRSNSFNASSPGSHLAYANVSEIQPNNGSTIFEYSIMTNSAPTNNEHPDNVYLGTSWTDNSWGRGKLLREAIYGEDGVIKQEKINTYNFNAANEVITWGLNARRVRNMVGCQSSFTMWCDDDPDNDTYEYCWRSGNEFLGVYMVGNDNWNNLTCYTQTSPCYGHLNEEVIANWNALDDYAFEHYRLRSRRVTLDQSQSFNYDENGENAIVVTTNYTYGPDHLNPITVNTQSGDVSQTVSITYPHEGNGHPYANEMVVRNMVSIPLATNVTGTVESAGKTVFTMHENMILPLEFYQQRGSSGLTLVGSLSYENDDPFPDRYQKANYPEPEIYSWYPSGSPKEGLLESKTYYDWVEEFDYNNNSRQLTLQKSIDDQETIYDYDEFQRLEIISARGGNMTTNFEYNYGGSNSVRTTTSFGGTADAQDSYEYFDGLGRFTSKVAMGYTPEGTDKVLSSTDYDAQGRAASQYSIGQGTTTFEYEASPLNRVKRTIPEIGEISVQYMTNTATIGDYNPASLTKQITRDENGNSSLTFTDVLGRTVLSRQELDGENVDTYYKYDEYGNIFTVTNPIGEQYVYNYDQLNRLHTKSIPGMQGVHTYTYYANDLLESSTDPNGNTLLNIYDEFDRLKSTSLDGTIQVQNMYDNDGVSTSASKGKLTESNTLVIGTGQLLNTKIVYDEYGRVYKTTSDNHIGGQDEIINSYDGADNVLSAVHTHSGFENYSITSSFEYDHSFRQTTFDFQLGTDPAYTISRHRYNNEDQLIQKSLYGPNSTNALQDIDYAYNSRGWLTHINDVPTGGDDEVIPDCDTDSPTECGPVCDWTVTINGTIFGTEYPIIGIYVKGDLLMDLSYPIEPPFSNLENEIENWLWDEGYTFGSVSVTAHGNEYTIEVLQSSIPFNKIRQSSPGNFSIETYFRKSNCDETEPPVSICELCRRDGYPCDKCPYWKLDEPCNTCQSLSITDCDDCTFAEDICTRCTNLGYPDCSSCPLSVDKIKPLKIKVEYDHGLLSSSNPSTFLVRVSDQYIAYQHDGTAGLRESQHTGIIGQGPYFSNTGPATYPNIMEIDLSNETIIASTLDAVLATAESQLMNELTSAGITNTTVQEDFVEVVLAAATTNWATTTGTEVPTDNSIPNPDLFSMELYYDQSHPMVSSPAQYNGNIAGMVWKTGFGSVNSYSFEYDAINRLESALFRDDIGGGNYAADNKYGVNLTYDAVGNIQSLRRRGVDEICNPTSPNPLYEFTQIDNLEYIYENNRLKSVTEGSNQTRGFKGTGGTYSYDDNGNMTGDQNKEMSSTYNHLNLPNTIDINGNSINFTYGAGGTKLKKHAVGQEAGEQVDNTTDYVGNIEYKNQSIEAIYHAEGRITFKRSDDESGSMKSIPEYYLKDHLGNVRVVFSDLNANGYLEPFAFDPDWPVLGDPQAYEPSELLQENHYYPFGMEMEGPWELSVSESENKYLFNGKERDSEFGLNWDHYGFRMYDSTIGRFPCVDPIADQFAHLSVYNYASNDPVGSIDLHGLQGIRVSEIAEYIVGNDDKGIITTATNEERESNPVRAGLKDGSYLVLKMLGLDALDNSIATYNDPDASGADVYHEMAPLLSPTKGKAVGKPKVKSPQKAIGPAGDAGATVTKQIPDGWTSKTTKKANGTHFVDPKNPKANNVRVMQGNPNSPNPSQQVDYVKHTKKGKVVDKNGNSTSNNTSEAHIPKEEFKIDN